MRQALPVRVRKPRVGLPLSIDILLRPRGRSLRTLHRCQALPALCISIVFQMYGP